MKIQCNVCDTAEATVLCCADEAALCRDCDEKVHAANKLASKHQRVSLSHSSSQIPKCDICQESVGYFFCLEDRALLCRNCDVAIHTANKHVAAHRRFLLTGVKVGLEAEPGSSASGCRTHSGEKLSDSGNPVAHKRSAPTSTTNQYGGSTGSVHSGVGSMKPPKRSMPMSASGEFGKMQLIQSNSLEDFTQSKMTFAGGSTVGALSPWPIDDFMGLSDFHQNYGFTENGTSKADSGKFGDSDSFSTLQSLEDDLENNEQLGQVPDVSHTKSSQVPSPPTASGLYWPRGTQQSVDRTVFVPDICWSVEPNYDQILPNHSAGKHRRQFY